MRGPLQAPTMYDIAQEQMRHDDVLGWYGEMTCFLHWWRIEDFNDGLVGRCTRCYLPYGDVADAYRQPAQVRCPQCYGSTLEGGFATIQYRPALWTTTPRSDDVELRGDVKKVNGTIQFTSDLSLTDGDLVVRADNSRWQMDQPTWQEITSGFGSQRGAQTKRLRGTADVKLEALDSVVYMPFVDFDALNDQGWRPNFKIPHRLDQVAPSPLGMDELAWDMGNWDEKDWT